MIYANLSGTQVKLVIRIGLRGIQGIDGPQGPIGEQGPQGGGFIFNEDIIVKLSEGKSFGKYINGQTIALVGKNIFDAFSDIAIEYIHAIFNSIIINGQPTTVEIGTTVSGSKVFQWALSENDSIIPTVDIFDVTGNAILGNDIGNTGSCVTNITSNKLDNNGDTQSFMIIGRDTNTSVDINSPLFVITSRFLRFFGANSISVTNSTQVRLLPNNAFQNGGSFTLATGSVQNKFIVALPPGITIVSVVDTTALNANITDSYELQGTVNVLDAGGTNRLYNIYEMNTAIPYSTSHNHLITTT